ncbi:MAG TPA: hypothetical protein VN033_13345 [Vulgatibacter sp.]|nr:hypothetical protein [Vulgatibacter sp.]
MTFARTALCLLLVATGCATAPLAPVREETIPLRFGWEPGAVAEVESVRSQTGWSPRGIETRKVALRYELAAGAGADGTLEVGRRNVRIDAMPAVWEPQAVELVAEELGKPDLVISATGSLTGIDEESRVQATVASLLGKLVQAGRAPESFRGRLSEVFGEEGLRRRAAWEWDELVGLWTGGDFEVGRTYHARDRVAIEGLGGIGLEMHFEARLVGRVPCGARDDGARCVHLELVSRPEPGQRPRLLAFVATLFPGRVAKGIEVEDRVTVITEPDALRPHRFVARRSVVIPFQDGDGGPARFEQLDERRLSFVWDGA